MTNNCRKFFWLLLLNYIITINTEQQCHSEEVVQQLNRHLGTKTAYRFVQHSDDSQVKYDGCQASRIWSIIRHGSRYPNRKTIKLMRSAAVEMRDKIVQAQQQNEPTLCKADLALFRAWQPDLHVENQMDLVLEGADELLNLAERIQHRFPNVLSDTYTNGTYRFKFTDTQRTRKSYEAFVTGLFGRNNIRHVWYPEPMKRDPVLRFYKLCRRWSVEVDKNEDTLHEIKQWYRGDEMLRAIDAISTKAGGLVGLMSVADAQLIYTLCAFETAWEKRERSPWCTLLDTESIKALEFAEDLDYYYVDGYGSELTYRQACPAIVDMLQRLDPKSTEPRATFYFTHSGTILKLLAHLGLYKDDYVLTHHDYERPRQWRVSGIDAFASNIQFVLFNCSDGPYISVLHQERPVHLTGCPSDSNLCSLELFKRLYNESLAHNCNFDEMCSLVDDSV